MEKKVELSVILPSLDVVDYIEECLKSVINQSYKNIEIICVDAGSVDGTRQIIEKYLQADSRVMLVESHRKSYGYQINLGIRKASGKYVGIVDTDDYIDANMYEVLMSYAKKTSYPDYVKMLYKSFRTYNGLQIWDVYNNNISANKYGKRVSLEKEPNLRLCDTNHIWSGIYLKKFIEEKQLWLNETSGASFQDTSFSILAGIMANSCCYLQDSLYNYRLDRDGSSINSDSKVLEVINEYSYVDRYIKRQGIDDYEIKSMIAKRKLDTYLWNYSRLDEKNRKNFIGEIQDELKEYWSERWVDSFTDFDKEKLTLLEKPELYVEKEKKEREIAEKICNLFDRPELYEEYVFVGAGNYFKKMVQLQTIFNRKIIKQVCDNKVEIQGKVIDGYKICSVETAYSNNKTAKWIVFNKLNTSNLINQLLKLGVKKVDILSSDFLPDISLILKVKEER